MTNDPLPHHLAIHNTSATDGGQSFAGINLGTITYATSETTSKLNDLLQKTLPVSADASFNARKREHEPTCLSNRLFIWAATACRFIEQGGQLAQGRLSLLLHKANGMIEPARMLDEIYTTVITNSVRGEYDEEETLQLGELFRQVVGPIIISPEPLSVPNLAKILGKDVEDLNRTLSNLHSVLHVPEAESGTIRLLHPSFRDFLLNQKRCSNSQFYIDEKLVHREMYINYLLVMSAHLRRDICNLRRPGADISERSRGEVDRDIQPHIQYACRFWVYHYKRSDVDIGGYHNVEKLLRRHFLHWLKALALLGCTSEAVVMVHMLDSGF